MPAVGDEKSGSRLRLSLRGRVPREDPMALRQTPPASDNIEIDDKHLRERFVTQKTYLDHCAQSYNYAADYGFKGPAGPREALSGGLLISITGLISLLLLFPLPSYLSPSSPSSPSQEALTRLPDGISLRDGSHPSLFPARNLELLLASRIALCESELDSIPITDCLLFGHGLNRIRRDMERNLLIVRRARVRM